MIERKTPIFTKGRILKNEMLTLMRDLPQQFIDITYQSYSDGIITGFHMTTDEGEITIHPGMLKYAGELFILNTPKHIKYEKNAREQFLKINFEKPYENEDFKGQSAHIILETSEPSTNQLLLARFHLSSGAYLRLDYETLEDFKTGHNTLNIVEQPNSSISGTTLSPIILEYFVKKLMGYKTQNTHDLGIIYHVLSTDIPVSFDNLEFYIKMRLNNAGLVFERNEQLHKSLNDVLDLARREQRQNNPRKNSTHKLIVD